MDIDLSTLPAGPIRQAVRKLVKELELQQAALTAQGGYISILEERVDALEDGGVTPDPEPTEELVLTKDALVAAYELWPYALKDQELSELSSLCIKFRDYLAATFTNVELVNEQAERHAYTDDHSAHADAFVLIRDRANPSQDVVVDFCFGSSEGGKLIDKLQCLWHDGPYTWWTDNALT